MVRIEPISKIVAVRLTVEWSLEEALAMRDLLDAINLDYPLPIHTDGPIHQVRNALNDMAGAL